MWSGALARPGQKLPTTFSKFLFCNVAKVRFQIVLLIGVWRSADDLTLRTCQWTMQRHFRVLLFLALTQIAGWGRGRGLARDCADGGGGIRKLSAIDLPGNLGDVCRNGARGAIDLEFAWEMAVDGAIAAACGMEGVRVDQAMVEAASDQAVAAFAGDAYGHMIETLCGGEPVTMARVRQRVEAMTGSLDAFQLRPGIDGLLERLHRHGLLLGATGRPWEQLERAGVAPFFVRDIAVPPEACIFVGDRLDKDIAPAKARGMATIHFRSGRYRRQRPRSEAEMPDAVVTDVMELEAALGALI